MNRQWSALCRRFRFPAQRRCSAGNPNHQATRSAAGSDSRPRSPARPAIRTGRVPSAATLSHKAPAGRETGVEMPKDMPCEPGWFPSARRGDAFPMHDPVKVPTARPAGCKTRAYHQSRGSRGAYMAIGPAISTRQVQGKGSLAAEGTGRPRRGGHAVVDGSCWCSLESGPFDHAKLSSASIGN